MKKFFIAAALFIASVMIFSGCSCSACNNETRFTGSMNWHKTKTYDTEFDETAVYDIVYRDDYVMKAGNYTYNFTASKPEGVTLNYGAGTYTTHVKAISKAQLPETAGTTESSEFYMLTTEFTLPVTYTYEDPAETYSFTDTITSSVYFESMQTSMQPLYSVKHYDTTQLSSGTVYRTAYSTEIKWADRAELKITNESESKTEYEENDRYKLRSVENAEKNVKYSKGCVLDNEELLFAVRSLALSTSYNGSLKILDTAYKSAQSLTVSCSRAVNVTDAWSLTLNGAEPKPYASTSTFLTAIVRSNSTYSGTATLCYYQIVSYDGDDQEITADSEGRGWLIKMVTKLPNSLGALEYRLKSITLSEKLI